jgi:hypothetical protein
MKTNFDCSICGGPAVAAHIFEDGSEHMYCAVHVAHFAMGEALEDTWIHKHMSYARAPDIERRATRMA